MGIFDTENICYLNCDTCNKKTCWDNINLNEKLFNDKNICEKFFIFFIIFGLLIIPVY